MSRRAVPLFCAGLLALGCSKRAAPSNLQSQGAARETPPASAAPVSPAALPSDPVARARPIMPDPPVAPEHRARSLPRSTESLLGEYGFPDYPSQKHLCGQREMRQGGETVTWDAFETPDSPEDVHARFAVRLSERGFVQNETFTGWRLPAGSPPTRELELVAAGRPSTADRCPTKPAPETRTVIVARRW